MTEREEEEGKKEEGEEEEGEEEEGEEEECFVCWASPMLTEWPLDQSSQPTVGKHQPRRETKVQGSHVACLRAWIQT